MRRFFLFLLVMVAVVTGAEAQEKFMSQCVTIQKASGDSIPIDISYFYGLSPQVKNGKIVWEMEFGAYDGMRKVTEEDVTSIDYRSEAEVRNMVRQALVEFYKATNGDKWNKNDNWCSNKPIDEWFGVIKGSDVPYVQGLELEGNNLTGHLPDGDCLLRMGSLGSLYLWDNEIGGTIPSCLDHLYTLYGFHLNRNHLTGEISEKLFELPYMERFEVEGSKLTGPMPAGLSRLMNQNFNVNVSGNDLSGEVPEAIYKHPRFSQLWDYILPQSGHLVLPDIPAPVFDVEDINGNRFSTADIYKDNVLTLLYNYSSAQSGYTDKLAQAYQTYKSKGFEVLGLIPGGKEEVMSYLHENNISWLNLDPEGFLDFFNRYFIYLNYVNLVDQNGNIVFTSLMDENGKMENTEWMGSTRDQLLFDVLAEKFGTLDYTLYTSTDYSRDGEVMTLQKATIGQGVDIVFVGNAFVDKDMEPGGKYEQKMKEAMEQFFAYEPYTSLRERFNVYAVKAVSPNKEIVEGATQAITSNEDAFAYAQKVKQLIADRPMRVNIVYNSYNAGRSVCYMYDDGSYVAWMYSGVNRVLNHEAGGHGVGRLLDEYVEDNANSVPSKEEKENLEKMWTELGQGANIDLHSDVTKTRWSRLAADKRYAAEGLGAYEGAATYGRDVYRPTQNSMMRYNDIPFNAPSREAIYKYVMQESEGKNWKYDYETFVRFDKKGLQQYVESLTSAGARSTDGGKLGDEREKEWLRPLPPVFVPGTWRDALKK